MRARLLDMGEVSAVRSQSLFSAVAAGCDETSEPVVILVKPAEPVVSVGGSAPIRDSVAIDSCRAERIPVVRSPRESDVWFQGPSHLLLQLVAPRDLAAEIGLIATAGRWPAEAARPLLAVCERLAVDAVVGERGRVEVAGRAIARFDVAVKDGVLGAFWDLFVGFERQELETEARFLVAPEGISQAQHVDSLASTRTGFGVELDEPLGFAQIAEELIGALEATFGLELVPSMPTPTELEGIYEWDERGLASELLEDVDRGAGRTTTYVM